jgi:hypothetical protein
VPTLSATRLVDLAFGGAQRITLKEGPVRDPDNPEQTVRGVELLALIVCLRRKTISLEVLARKADDDTMLVHEYARITRPYILAGPGAYTRDALTAIVEKALPLAERILSGGAIRHNAKHEPFGRLDEDAADADLALRSLSLDFPQERPRYAVLDAKDWLEKSDFRDIWPDGVSLEDAAADLQEEASGGDLLLAHLEDALLHLAKRALRQDESLDALKIDALHREGYIQQSEANLLLARANVTQDACQRATSFSPGD